uniref:Uncharacterized protein n=1 Tax=Leersia perrieri TaxID=77586 RepID=A0A0D9VNT6_9ORYZ
MAMSNLLSFLDTILIEQRRLAYCFDRPDKVCHLKPYLLQLNVATKMARYGDTMIH